MGFYEKESIKSKGVPSCEREEIKGDEFFRIIPEENNLIELILLCSTTTQEAE